MCQYFILFYVKIIVIWLHGVLAAACGIYSLTRVGPVPLRWKHKVLVTGPPGKFQYFILLQINNILLLAYTFCSSVSQLMDIWLTIMNNCAQVFLWFQVFNSLHMYLGVELLGQTVTLSLTFLRNH